MKKEQTIYICLDDSGKLTKKENFTIYGGLVFFSKKERDKFITQYRSIINEFKCKYCHNKCNNRCPEIKCSNIKPKHRRRIMNYIKKYYVISTIIDNKEVFPYILNNKASKGRYIDYCIRRFIKETINNLIKEKKIDAHRPLNLIIEIDEQSTKDNGYYNLKDGLIEELVHGITNFDYGFKVNPIIFNGLNLDLSYRNSKHSFPIQAADLIAGTTRRTTNTYYNNKLEFNSKLFYINYLIIFP